jgi:hypothetical protein
MKKLVVTFIAVFLMLALQSSAFGQVGQIGLLGVGGASGSGPSTPGRFSGALNSLTYGYFTSNNTVYTLNGPPTHANNVVLVYGWTNDATAPSGLKILDNASNTYTLLDSVNDATTGNTGFIFCGVQSSPASQWLLEATTNLGGTYQELGEEELYNVATGSGGCTSADQTWTHVISSASTTVTAGSSGKTTSTANDLIFMFFFGSDGTQYTGTTPITPGSQTGVTWYLPSGSTQNWDSMAAMEGLYTLTSSLNPTLTISNSGTTIALAVALKAASSGSAPSSTIPYASGVQHVDVTSATAQGPGPHNNTSPVKIQVPTSEANSTIVLTGPSSYQYDPSAISSSAGETWVQAENLDGSSASGSAWIWYACNASASNSRVLTVTMGGTAADVPMTFYTVPNTATSSCLDTGGTASGTQSTAGASVTAFSSITTVANEFYATTTSNQAGTGVSGTTGWNSDAGDFQWGSGTASHECSAGINPPQPVDECNALAWLVPSSSGTTSVVNTQINSVQAVGGWVAAWASFKHK